jgi:Flp pilus assembly protein TadD
VQAKRHGLFGRIGVTRRSATGFEMERGRGCRSASRWARFFGTFGPGFRGLDAKGLHYNRDSIAGASALASTSRLAGSVPSIPAVSALMTHSDLLRSACLMLAALAPAVAARADDFADVSRLQAAGETRAALERAGTALATRPKDARLRFLKGVLLADLKRNDEALVEFQQLTEDFPELSEPYNNIAALQAAAGRYDKSREALESALRANPGYAVAHENLGDVYAMLASQAYARSIQLAPGNRTAPPKLAMLRELLKAPAPTVSADAAPVR